MNNNNNQNKRYNPNEFDMYGPPLEINSNQLDNYIGPFNNNNNNNNNKNSLYPSFNDGNQNNNLFSQNSQGNNNFGNNNMIEQNSGNNMINMNNNNGPQMTQEEIEWEQRLKELDDLS